METGGDRVLIESDDLREELNHPVWTENGTPDYAMGWRDAYEEVKKCIQQVEEEQRCRNEVEKAQEDVVAWRIKESVKAILTNDEVKRPVIDHYYELTHRTVDLETMPLNRVPIGGVVIDKFDEIINVYVKTAEQIGEDDFAALVLKQIYPTNGFSNCLCYFNNNALVAFTGIVLKGELK